MTQATPKGRPLDDELTGRVLNEVREALDAEVIPLIEARYMKKRHMMGHEILDRVIARGQVGEGLDQDLIIDTIAGLTLFRLSLKPDAWVHSDDELKDSYRRLIRSLVASPD